MSAFDNLTIHRRGKIAEIVFDRQERLNALDGKSIAELTQAARSFHDDMETQAVVLSGSPKAFSAGMDLKERAGRDLSGQSDNAKRYAFHAGGRMCKAWEEMPQITIAAIEGMAVGGGVALAIALDWRVIASNAYLYVPEVKVGLNLQWGALPRLIALAGPARAKRVCILCEKLPAVMAKEWGLAEEVVPAGSARTKALELAELAASMPEAAVRMIKEAVNATSGALHQAASYGDADISQLAASFGRSAEAIAGFGKKGG